MRLYFSNLKFKILGAFSLRRKNLTREEPRVLGVHRRISQDIRSKRPIVPSSQKYPLIPEIGDRSLVIVKDSVISQKLRPIFHETPN